MVSDYSVDENFKIPVSFHQCSKDEISELAPPSLEAKDWIEDELDEENTTSLFCIDWEKHASELSLRGQYSSDY